MSVRSWIGSSALLLSVAGTASGLVAWKQASLEATAAASASQPEPMAMVKSAATELRPYQRTTTSIGTVLSLRSITLRNELPGTVREVALETGRIVEAGTVLVALDVSVEEAELRAQRAQASLAETQLARLERASKNRGVSASEVDRARAERDVALAMVERLEAVIERKTLRAPFRARVGLADVHPGQYLNEGTELTTLQGVDDAVHVDFTVTQDVAAGLRVGAQVSIVGLPELAPIEARIEAIDALIDPRTRNALVRARIDGAEHAPAPGASVRVRVPIGAEREAVVVPVNALRKSPAGDHVFVLVADEAGGLRAHQRRVESGAVLDGVVVIESGLAIGEEVAASGSFKLFEGMLVGVAGDTEASTVAGN